MSKLEEKAIGDAYMAAEGLNDQEDHTIACVKAGKEMNNILYIINPYAVFFT